MRRWSERDCLVMWFINRNGTKAERDVNAIQVSISWCTFNTIMEIKKAPDRRRDSRDRDEEWKSGCNNKICRFWIYFKRAERWKRWISVLGCFDFVFIVFWTFCTNRARRQEWSIIYVYVAGLAHVGTYYCRSFFYQSPLFCSRRRLFLVHEFWLQMRKCPEEI